VTSSPARTSLRANLKGLPRPAWVLFAGAFVNRLGTFVLPFVTLYLRGEGYSAPQAGLGLAAYGLGAIGAQAGGGLLADRLGRRRTIVLSMTGGAACALALLVVHSLSGVIVIVALMGFVGELYRPASSALITDLTDRRNRVAAFSAYRLLLNLGWAVGLALGGLLFERSPELLFIGDAVTSLGFAVVAFAGLPHGTRTRRDEERHLASARSSIRADTGFLLGLGCVFLTASVYMQNATTFALRIQDLGFSASTYGFLQAGNGVLVVLLELPISSWTQHRVRTHMMALGALGVGLGFTILIFARTIPGIALMVLIWTLGEIVESPATSAFVADRAPEHARGRYQGALGSMYAFAAVLSPLVGTSIYHVSPTALWFGCGAVGLIAAGLALAAGHRPSPPTEPAAMPSTAPAST
jgi:MFS family permease